MGYEKPLQLPPFFAALSYDMGTVECAKPKILFEHPALPDKALSGTFELWQDTLLKLNLNCDRLCQAG